MTRTAMKLKTAAAIMAATVVLAGGAWAGEDAPAMVSKSVMVKGLEVTVQLPARHTCTELMALHAPLVCRAIYKNMTDQPMTLRFGKKWMGYDEKRVGGTQWSGPVGFTLEDLDRKVTWQVHQVAGDPQRTPGQVAYHKPEMTLQAGQTSQPHEGNFLVPGPYGQFWAGDNEASPRQVADNLPAGHYRLTCHYDVAELGRFAVGPLSFEVPGPAVLKGILVDAAGKPLANTRVMAGHPGMEYPVARLPQELGQATTDAQGQFSLEVGLEDTMTLWTAEAVAQESVKPSLGQVTAVGTITVKPWPKPVKLRPKEPRPICFGGLFKELGAAERVQAGIETGQGAVLTVSLEPDSVGERGGMRPGDILVGFAGQPLAAEDTIEALRAIVIPLKQQGHVSRTVDVLRDSKPVRLVVTW